MKALAEILSAEHDDVSDLAKLVITTLDELRKDRIQHVLVVRYPTPYPVMVYGPYNTPHQANKASTKLASPGLEPATAGVFKLNGTE